jgi:hypothetical protein
MRGSFFRPGVTARTGCSVRIVALLQWSASKHMANKHGIQLHRGRCEIPVPGFSQPVTPETPHTKFITKA